MIRLHTERIENPRSLWVPFELGRPLGPPRDAGFQLNVMTQALQLLTAENGPVILADFPDEDPTSVDLPNWAPPFDLAPPEANLVFDAALEKALQHEAAKALAAYEQFVKINGRTTVGLSRMDVEVIINYVASFPAQTGQPEPPQGVTAVQLLRWAVDDLKAFYLEAMSAGPEIPASRQMQTWFWDRTLAARVIIALRRLLLGRDDKQSQLVGRMNLVPSAQVQRLGLE
ncbi:MAG: hypothetical protein JO289_21625 [Xanthobacteraceae bacterium]|nr:hypothetical protein [Xanthobacteraceae bacterium]